MEGDPDGDGPGPMSGDGDAVTAAPAEEAGVSDGVYGASSGADAFRREATGAERGCDGGVSMSISSSRLCLLKPRSPPGPVSDEDEAPGVCKPASWLSSESSGCGLVSGQQGWARHHIDKRKQGWASCWKKYYNIIAEFLVDLVAEDAGDKDGLHARNGLFCDIFEALSMCSALCSVLCSVLVAYCRFVCMSACPQVR